MPLATRAVPDMLSDDGASLYQEFISVDEEAELLAFLDSQPWDETIKRRTQHFSAVALTM